MKIADEKSAPSVSGSVPVWIDVGDNQDLIPQAVATIRNQHFQQTEKHQQYLLYDGPMDVDFLKLCWADPETCLHWSCFIGCEATAIVMLTTDVGAWSSYLEMSSRAKMNLAIVTYRHKTFPSLYRDMLR